LAELPGGEGIVTLLFVRHASLVVARQKRTERVGGRKGRGPPPLYHQESAPPISPPAFTPADNNSAVRQPFLYTTSFNFQIRTKSRLAFRNLANYWRECVIVAGSPFCARSDAKLNIYPDTLPYKGHRARGQTLRLSVPAVGPTQLRCIPLNSCRKNTVRIVSGAKIRCATFGPCIPPRVPA